MEEKERRQLSTSPGLDTELGPRLVVSELGVSIVSSSCKLSISRHDCMCR